MRCFPSVVSLLRMITKDIDIGERVCIGNHFAIKLCMHKPIECMQ